MALLKASLKKSFLAHFPDPDKLKKGEERDPYGVVKEWFGAGNEVDLLNDNSDKAYHKALLGVAGLEKVVNQFLPQVNGNEKYLYMELVLHGLAACDHLNKNILEAKMTFKDFLSDMFNDDQLFN